MLRPLPNVEPLHCFLILAKGTGESVSIVAFPSLKFNDRPRAGWVNFVP